MNATKGWYLKQLGEISLNDAQCSLVIMTFITPFLRALRLLSLMQPQLDFTVKPEAPILEIFLDTLIRSIRNEAERQLFLHNPKPDKEFWSVVRHPSTKMPKPKRNINAAMQETLSPPPSLEPNQEIARLIQAAGNNLYHVEFSSGTTVLAELESKFRSTIWLKRGCYVVVDTSSLAGRENKIGGQIVNIAGDEKAWRKASFWPTEFVAKKSSYGDDSDDGGPQMPPSDDEADQ